MFTGTCVDLPQVTLTQDKGSWVLPAAACCDGGETGTKKAGDRDGSLGWSRVPSRWAFPRIPSRPSVSAVTRPVDPPAHSGSQELADSSRPATLPGSGPDRKQPLGSVPSFPKRDSPSLTPAVHARVAGERLSQNERSPVATVGGPRRDAVDVNLRLHTENRLVLALLHRDCRSSPNFRLLLRPLGAGTDATLRPALSRAALAGSPLLLIHYPLPVALGQKPDAESPENPVVQTRT